MSPVDIVILVVILGILGFAGWFIYRSKKSGAKCIGCPSGGNCSGHCGGGESCTCCKDKE